MEQQRPPFLDGTFEWNALGYRFAAPPPTLPDPLSLPANDERLVLASTLEYAKKGDWRGLPRLVDTMRQSNNALVWRACAELLGDAGSISLLKKLLQRHEGEMAPDGSRVFQENIAFALHETCSLAAVPIILNLYLQSENRKEAMIMVLLLSHLLEPELGPITETDVSDDVYRGVVLKKLDELSEKHGSQVAPVLYGELFSARSLAETLSAHVKNLKMTWLMYDRQLLESCAGADFRGFYRDRRFQPLEAAAILETLLDSSELERFKPGVRYFFGHRIPD